MGEVIRFPIEQRIRAVDGVETVSSNRVRVRIGARHMTLCYIESPTTRICIVDVPFPAAWDDGELMEADELDRVLDRVAVWCSARARRIRLSWSYCAPRA